jgi:hypothetical protein
LEFRSAKKPEMKRIDERYFAAIEKYGERHGYKVHNLNDGKIELFYHQLHVILNNLIKNSKKNQIREINLVARAKADYPKEDNFYKICSKLQNKLFLNRKTLIDLEFAITFKRSLLMYGSATRKNLKHIIVGTAHAHDINLEEKIRLSKTKRFRNNSVIRKEMYNEYKKALDEIDTRIL